MKCAGINLITRKRLHFACLILNMALESVNMVFKMRMTALKAGIVLNHFRCLEIFSSVSNVTGCGWGNQDLIPARDGFLFSSVFPTCLDRLWPSPSPLSNGSSFTYISEIYLKSQLKIFVVIFILSVHNMFRPLRAIIRWNTTTSFIYFEIAIDTTTDPLFYNCSLMWCKSLIIYLQFI
jgi:hypothetical protein